MQHKIRWSPTGCLNFFLKNSATNTPLSTRMPRLLPRRLRHNLSLSRDASLLPKTLRHEFLSLCALTCSKKSPPPIRLCLSLCLPQISLQNAKLWFDPNWVPQTFSKKQLENPRKERKQHHKFDVLFKAEINWRSFFFFKLFVQIKTCPKCGEDT
jgi:hypothetical protein